MLNSYFYFYEKQDDLISNNYIGVLFQLDEDNSISLIPPVTRPVRIRSKY